MSGKLSFIGDTIKAMSLQRIQKDLNRLYTEARAEAGDLDAVFERAADEAPGQSQPRPAGPFTTAAVRGQVASGARILAGDIRDEVVRAVEEMYAHGLITSTGGNVSVRIPGQRRSLDHTQFVLQGRASPRHAGADRSRGQPDRRFPLCTVERAHAALRGLP